MRTILALLSLAIASPATALLIERDLLAPGDGLVTRDTDTGLEWLDATLTLDLSTNQVLAGAGGWIGAGWRYATLGETCALFENAGAATLPCPSAGFLPGAAGQLLLDRLGVTRSATSGSSFEVEQLWAWFEGGQVELSVDTILATGGLRTFTAIYDTADPDDAIYYFGSLLVRVPEPTPLPILGSACLLALWIRAGGRAGSR